MTYFESQNSQGVSLTDHIVFFDLEWTSWEGSMDNNYSEPWQHQEVIQIGAVRVDPMDEFSEVSAFNQYVIPQINSELSDYIVKLTGITQTKIDVEGIPFQRALNLFAAFTENWRLPTYSWGHDWVVLKQACELYKLSIPEGINNNMHDLRQKFLTAGLDVDEVYSGDLHSHFGLSLNLHAHDALHDVRSMTAAVAHLTALDSQLFGKLL